MGKCPMNTFGGDRGGGRVLSDWTLSVAIISDPQKSAQLLTPALGNQQSHLNKLMSSGKKN
jgi:hypothetical protein